MVYLLLSFSLLLVLGNEFLGASCSPMVANSLSTWLDSTDIHSSVFAKVVPPGDFLSAEQLHRKAFAMGLQQRRRGGAKEVKVESLHERIHPLATTIYDEAGGASLEGMVGGRSELTTTQPFRANPFSFGGDPSGQKDSTSAVMMAVAAVLNHTATLPKMAAGIANGGGAMLDLAGGAFLISEPVVFPTFVGNVRIGGSGSLRASSNFPSDRFLIEIGSNTRDVCHPPGRQGVCNEFITVQDVFLDASHIAAGGIRVAMTMGTTITNSFITGFNVAGIQVNSGHETMVSECWLTEYYWSEKRPQNLTCDRSTTGSGSVGILIDGEDNILTDIIIFDFTCFGVWLEGAANLVTGVHSWNGGGVAIALNASNARSDRIVNCYLDYNTLEIVNPSLVLVQGNFFFHTALNLMMTEGKSAEQLIVRENTYVAYGAPMPQSNIIISSSSGNHSSQCSQVTVEDEIAHGPKIRKTRVRKVSEELKNTKVFVLDFSQELVFGQIDWVQYSLQLSSSSSSPNSGSSSLSHWSQQLNSTAVAVYTSEEVDGKVYVEVAECSMLTN